MARAVVADSTNVQVQWSEVPVVESSLKWKFSHLGPLRHDKVVTRVGFSALVSKPASHAGEPGSNPAWSGSSKTLNLVP